MQGFKLYSLSLIAARHTMSFNYGRAKQIPHGKNALNSLFMAKYWLINIS